MTQCEDLIDPVQVRGALTVRCGDVDGYARAVLAAAADAGLLGAGGALPAGYLHRAAPGYCTPAELSVAPAGWVDAAVASVTAAGAMAAGEVAADGSAAGHALAVHMRPQLSPQIERRLVPATTWTALHDTVTDAADAATVGHHAGLRHVFGVAESLLRRAIDAGHDRAVWTMAMQLEQRADVSGLRQLALAGHARAAEKLAETLGRRDDESGLRQLAADLARVRADRRYVGAILSSLLSKRGDEAGLRALAGGPDQHIRREAGIHLMNLEVERLVADEDEAGLRRLHASGEYRAKEPLARLLAGRGDEAGLRELAATGDYHACRALAALMVRHGDEAGLRELAAGGAPVGEFLASLLAERGDEAGLRAGLADPDDEFHMDLELSDLLQQRHDEPALRARVAEGSQAAVFALAGLLGDRGDEAGLRELLVLVPWPSDAHQEVGRALAALLAERDDDDGLRELADAGNTQAAERLAQRLAQQDAEAELRVRANAGDLRAGVQLADLLAARDDRAGLCLLVIRGYLGAAYRLGKMLDATDPAAAGRFRRYGLTPAGQIAQATDMPPAR